MTRYVLLEFESNEHAERFVDRTLQKEGAGSRFRVIGFFAKPRKFCQCGYLSDSVQAKEVRRGQKYGWMVHTKCGRPRAQASHSPRNLLDPQGTHPTRVASFLHLAGEWARDKYGNTGEGPWVLANYPISVRTRDDDK